MRPIGLELKLEADLGRTRLRGIIDRLELDENGEFVVTDYKTGSVPSELWEAKSLAGVHVYALLCERMLGRRPARVQLYYLSKPEAIIATPSDQSIRGVERRTSRALRRHRPGLHPRRLPRPPRPPLQLLHLQALLPRPRRRSRRRGRAPRAGHGGRPDAAPLPTRPCLRLELQRRRHPSGERDPVTAQRLRRDASADARRRVHELDLRVDKFVDRVRGPRLDPVFYGLSSAADHGLLWLSPARRAPRAGDPGVALRMGAVLSVESVLTNGAIKACFRRVRPDDDHPPEGPLPYGMHRPISSSFPSGHATSAFTAAMLLAGGPGHARVVRARSRGRRRAGCTPRCTTRPTSSPARRSASCSAPIARRVSAPR